MAKKRVQKDDSDDEAETQNNGAGAAGAPKKVAEKGWNYTAIAIMLMFLLPGLIAVVLQVSDIMYPEQKALRQIKERVIRCYEVANPSKVDDVDRIVEKYKNREIALFAQLRNKYPKIPQCG